MGQLYIDIFGHNFGTSLEDIEYVKVKGVPCTSLLRISSEHVRCISFKSGLIKGAESYNLEVIAEEIDGLIQVQDIELRTIAGSVRGINLDADKIVRSRSFRPAITDIRFQNSEFYPQTIYYVPPETNVVGAKGTLYWTNVMLGHFVLQRSFVDGSQIETVLNYVQLGVDMHILQEELSGNLEYLNPANSSNLPTCAYRLYGSQQPPSPEEEIIFSGPLSSFIPRSPSNSASNTASMNCKSVGHVVF